MLYYTETRLHVKDGHGKFKKSKACIKACKGATLITKYKINSNKKMRLYKSP